MFCLDDELQKMKEKRFLCKGFGFHYLDVLTNQNETIKGGSLYLFGKQCLTIAISNTLWCKENGEPYKLGIENSVVFIGKFSIGFGSS